MTITPLDPACNYMDILAQHLKLLREGHAVLKPVYRHSDGTFGPPAYIEPGRFLIVEGLLGYHDRGDAQMFDIRVYLDPPESMRRRWKVVRDCSRRGYTTDQVLEELDRREPDSEAYIRPQRHHADIVVRSPRRRAWTTRPTRRTWTPTCYCGRSCRIPTWPTWSATASSGCS